MRRFKERSTTKHNDFVEAMESRSYVVYEIQNKHAPDFCVMLPGGKNIFVRFGIADEWTRAHDRDLRRLGHGIFCVTSTAEALLIIQKITGRP